MVMPDAEIDAIRHRLLSRPRPAGLSERRARLDGFGQAYALPADVAVEPVQVGGVAAEWTVTPQADPARVVLFLHGGGYIAGSLLSHRHLVAEIGRQARARTLALDYRLAPEHPFPAALEDAVAAYRFLLAQGLAPERIALAGESAGGGLAVAALCRLRDAGIRLPGAVWCSSPWVDLEMRGGTMTVKAELDPLIQRPYLEELASLYLGGGSDARDPLVSPIHADLRGLPPMLIQVGSAETLLDDALRLAAVAAAADVRVTLEVWPEMIHAWTLFHPEVAQGRAALAALGRFIRGTLPP